MVNFLLFTVLFTSLHHPHHQAAALKICKLHRNGWLRGVFTQGGRLKLLVEENLYELTLLPSHVDSVKGRLRMAALVDRGHWSTADPAGVSFLARHLPPAAQQLLQVAHLRGAHGVAHSRDGYLLAVVGSTDPQRGVMLHYLMRLGGQPKLLYLGRAVERYVIFGPTDPSQAKGLILRMGANWSLQNSVLVHSELVVKNFAADAEHEPAFILPPLVPFDPEAGARKYRLEVNTDDEQQQQQTFFSVHLSKAGLTLKAKNASLGDNEGKGRPKELPVQATKRFGFLAGAYAHIWDMKAKTVAVVELVPARAGRLYPVRYVPMEAYFACDDAEWEQEGVTVTPASAEFEEEPPTQSTSSSSFLFSSKMMMIIVGGAVGALLLLVSLLVGWLVIRSRRGRLSRRGGDFTSEGSTSSSSSSSSSSPASSTPTSSSFASWSIARRSAKKSSTEAAAPSTASPIAQSPLTDLLLSTSFVFHFFFCLVCKLHRNGWLRGVYTQAGQLRLLVEDNLYELPLLPGNVDSFKGRLRMAALVDRGHWHQADPEGLSHFYRNLPPDEPLLKPAAQLVQVAHFKGDNGQGDYLFCIVGSTRAKTGVMLHYLLHLGRLPKMLYLGRAVEKYVVLGPTDPGETKGLILRLGGTWGLESSILVQGDLVVKNETSKRGTGEQIFTLPPVPFDPEAAAASTRGHHRFEMATDDGQTAFFSMTLSREGLRLKATTNASLAANAGSQPKERNVKTTKRFGFLAGAYAHIWDMKAKTVEVVELAAARAGRTYPVLYVPMDVYFACDEAEWARERVTSAPLDFDAPAPTADDDDDDPGKEHAQLSPLAAEHDDHGRHSGRLRPSELHQLDGDQSMSEESKRRRRRREEMEDASREVMTSMVAIMVVEVPGRLEEDQEEEEEVG
ncbi:hypothetical protein TYRP_015583 [Tyrophagus putrescentiae]|nr:hypothetical protein TYRP_015583 [Tyrophagus putrescentiae]